MYNSIDYFTNCYEDTLQEMKGKSLLYYMYFDHQNVIVIVFITCTCM